MANSSYSYYQQYVLNGTVYLLNIIISCLNNPEKEKDEEKDEEKEKEKKKKKESAFQIRTLSEWITAQRIKCAQKKALTSTI